MDVFWGCASARNLWRKSYLRYCFARNIFYHRNLDGIYTDVFGVAYGKKSLEEIFFNKMLLTQEIF
ncbi:hypothetical protein CIK97_02110 [Prevotella sp. P3-120]|nr:hypothetical protein CIK97_02110 [Prevotella sp. P3-120]OYP53122.1 hypothetical protein CIK93_00595 [Prevotella sp. P3-92]